MHHDTTLIGNGIKKDQPRAEEASNGKKNVVFIEKSLKDSYENSVKREEGNVGVGQSWEGHHALRSEINNKNHSNFLNMSTFPKKEDFHLKEEAFEETRLGGFPVIDVKREDHGLPVIKEEADGHLLNSSEFPVEFSIHLKVEEFINSDLKSKKKASSKTSSVRSRKNPESPQNIIKNYARAFTNFALSPMSLNYSKIALIEHGITLKEFQSFMYQHRTKINCIKGLREVLLTKLSDSKKMLGSKKVFGYLCGMFLKYFAVNWLYSSKIEDKLIHLSYRFKILRRVRSPEHFTYLEG